MKDYRQANKGKPFEDFLKFVHMQYQNTGIACVHKVPTEFIPIRDYKGKIVSCKVEEKSCVDYLGRYKSIPVAVEAKHESGSRINFHRVEPHQKDYMEDFCRDKSAVGIVIVSFGLRRFFAVPWPFWHTAMLAWEEKRDGKSDGKYLVTGYGWEWKTPGMASASPEQFHPDWEIKEGGASGLPYLEIIDKMLKNSSKNKS